MSVWWLVVDVGAFRAGDGEVFGYIWRWAVVVHGLPGSHIDVYAQDICRARVLYCRCSSLRLPVNSDDLNHPATMRSEQCFIFV